jgi:flagellar biosynthesis/type III secretory pathway chaperone
VNNDTRHQLESLLDREIQLAEELATTLAREREALTGSAAAEVAAQAQRKVDLLAEFATLEGERLRLWEPPVDEFAQSVAARWRSLMQLMARCRSANDVNGYMINVRRSQVGQLIDILRGGSGVTYGPEGKTFVKALRALARA